MFRVRTLFTGVAGSPWYSNIYFDPGAEGQASSCVDAVGTFWEALTPRMSSSVTFEVEGTVLQIAPGSGEILDFISTDAVVGNGESPAFIAPTQTQVVFPLKTATVRAGRLVQGRIFAPGMVGAVFDDKGNVGSIYAAEFNAAINDLLESEGGGILNGLVVWSRPRTVVGITIPGLACPVAAASANRVPGVLRSRRD